AFPSISLALDQGRPFARPCPSDCFGRVLVDLEDIVAVDDMSRNAVGLRTDRDVLHRGNRLHGGEFTESVVLTCEDHRQLPYRGEVQRFMKSAFVGCAVSEEARADIVFTRDYRSECGAGRDWQPGADNPVGAEDTERVIDDVHRSALTLAVAAALAKDLRHHTVEASALCQQMAMAAMSGGNAIGLAQCGANAGGAGLLADRNMHESRNFVGQCQIAHLRFELPDSLHRSIHLKQLVFPDIHRGFASFGRLAPWRCAGLARLQIFPSCANRQTRPV